MDARIGGRPTLRVLTTSAAKTAALVEKRSAIDAQKRQLAPWLVES